MRTLTSAVTVSIHALAWRATDRQRNPSRPVRVSIHALAWRATAGGVLVENAQYSFNSRPRMEGDRCLRMLYACAVAVSIHALAWRATDYRL